MSAAKPRKAYYAFAHQALPEIFFSGPKTLVDTLSQHGASFPRYVWSKMEEYTGVDGGVQDQIDVQVHQLGQSELALVICPVPENVTEVYFIGMLLEPADETSARYFTLEYGVDFTGQVYTVLGEWTADYIHHNHGEGPPPEMDRFLETIKERCNL